MVSIALFGVTQNLTTSKVVIVNDSIYEMSSTNGRDQLLIAAPGANKSIMIENIAIMNSVGARLYSPDSGSANYLIGYRNGSYWYTVSEFSWDALNQQSNTNYSFVPPVDRTVWDALKTNNSPLMIRFNKPMNFSSGSNTLTIYITYWILN